MVAVHSTARGPSLGGCRMWTYDDSRAAVRDALRLSRAMTFKSAVAGLPLGGGKGVIMLPGRRARRSTPARRRDALLDFGDAVDALGGRYMTAEDVGTSDARHGGRSPSGTAHVAGLALERGGSGDPSPWTALGVEAAIERDLRARCSAPPTSPAARIAVHRPRPRRRARSRARLRARPAPRSCSPTSTRASARSPTSSARAGRRPPTR